MRKNATIHYSPAVPKTESPIGRDIPAYACLEWRDQEGRRNRHILELSPAELKTISELPDVPPDCVGYPKCDGDLEGNPHEPCCPRYGTEG